MRVAWFSPMPPVRTGIAVDSAELVRALRATHQVDTYVHHVTAVQPRGRVADDLDSGRPMSAHEFVWRHQRQPYDLTVFQLGNSSHHDYIWPYLFRYPGLAVLHDAHLHHARAAALLRTKRADDYRAELAANHPDQPPAMAELAVAGFDSHLYYSWPMTRLIAAASRLTAVHAPALAEQLRADVPGAAIESIRLGHGVPIDAARRATARARIRAKHAITGDALVFGVFGGLTPEKRLPQLLAAFSATLRYAPSSHLLLAGAPARHYDVAGAIAAHDIAPRVTLTGYIESDEELTDTIAAADVSMNLRWPTAREMSGPWLRALAAGVATVTVDLWHTWHVPSLDPRTWQSRDNGDSGGGADTEAVTVAIDILDEDHSLRLAMRRLASDPPLRASLAAAGRRYWEREHAIEQMVADYQRVMAQAAARPAPRVALPAHLVDRGDRVLNATLARCGLDAPIWSKL